MYEDIEGNLRRPPMLYGVPQGPVLELLLWNVGFDWILISRLPPGLNVICYADDTFSGANL